MRAHTYGALLPAVGRVTTVRAVPARASKPLPEPLRDEEVDEVQHDAGDEQPADGNQDAQMRTEKRQHCEHDENPCDGIRQEPLDHSLTFQVL